MNLDLFADAETASPAQYVEAVHGWLAEAGQAGTLHRESSAEVAPPPMIVPGAVKYDR